MFIMRLNGPTIHLGVLVEFVFLVMELGCLPPYCQHLSLPRLPGDGEVAPYLRTWFRFHIHLWCLVVPYERFNKCAAGGGLPLNLCTCVDAPVAPPLAVGRVKMPAWRCPGMCTGVGKGKLISSLGRGW